MTFRKILQPLFLALSLMLLAPGLAAADSLVFVKSGDVWVSEPDGSRQTRLTSDGGYKYASQSENGVIAASRGSRVVRISRSGKIEASFPTSVGDNDSYGPYDTEISPDGKHIAYEYFQYSDFWGLRIGVAYIDASTGEHIGETQTGWSFPAWIDNLRLIHSGAPNKLITDVMIRELGEPNNTAIDWFSHPDAGGIRDGDISRDSGKLAFVGGENDELLLVYRRTGELGVDTPEYCYHYLEPNGKYRDPAISPDGRKLAWQEDDGIHVGPLPDFSAGCSMPADEGGLVIPGAINPDWGPASVPSPPKPSIRLAGRQKLGTVLTKGLVLIQSGIKPGTRVTAKISASVAKRFGLGRTARVVASGKSGSKPTLRIRFSGAAARKLRKAKSLPLTVAAGGARAAITLRR